MPSTIGSRNESRQSVKPNAGRTALRDLAASTLSAEALVELIERLGLKDLLVSRLKSRIEDTDVDALIDDAVDYFRGKPEAIVIGLGALTLAAGAMVFLESRREDVAKPSAPELVRPLPPKKKAQSPRSGSGRITSVEE